MRHFVIGSAITLLLTGAAQAPLGAQERAVEFHPTYARTTQTHQASWGAGAQYALTWGGTKSPIQLGTSVAGDYQKQEHGGTSQTGASVDVVVQPGGGHPFTPYVGGSVGAAWLSGSGTPSGAQPSLQGIVGAQMKLSAQGPLALHAELRPGYVRTQEHALTVRLGLSSTL